MNKLRAGLRAIVKVKNWITYYKDYFHLIKNQNIIYWFRNGMGFVARSGTSDRGIITSVVISDEHHIKDLWLPKDAVVVDVGAQIGAFSVYVAKKAGTVLAFEPEPSNYNYLLKNIVLNNLSNIKPFKVAVSDKEETIRIHYSDDNTGAHSKYLTTEEFVDVDAISLEQVFKNNDLQKIDLLKLDVEGSEYEILFGLPPRYFTIIKMMIIELHDISHEKLNKESLVAYLAMQGYEILVEDDYLFCKKSDFGGIK